MDFASLTVRAGAAVSGTGTSGCTGPDERSRTLGIAHVCAHFSISQVWPHRTATCAPSDCRRPRTRAALSGMRKRAVLDSEEGS